MCAFWRAVDVAMRPINAADGKSLYGEHLDTTLRMCIIPQL
jgi:hypothetical protein